jgi:hypothetical protein
MATITEAYLKDVAFDDDYSISETGDLATVEGLENVKQALFRRYVTTKGTLAHRPNYGAGLKEFQNSVATLKSKLEMTNRIEEQSLRDPRVEKVLGVGFESDDGTPEKTKIFVRIKLIGYGEVIFTYQPFGE